MPIVVRFLSPLFGLCRRRWCIPLWKVGPDLIVLKGANAKKTTNANAIAAAKPKILALLASDLFDRLPRQHGFSAVVRRFGFAFFFFFFWK
jgi:hypothetical protein